jgi:hypothetical protein
MFTQGTRNFYDGNKEVISRLGDVAKQVRLMEECRKSIAEDGVRDTSIAAEFDDEFLRTTQVMAGDARVEMVNGLELQEVISRLGDVAKQVRLMEECRKSIAEDGVFSHHH